MNFKKKINLRIKKRQITYLRRKKLYVLKGVLELHYLEVKYWLFVLQK